MLNRFSVNRSVGLICGLSLLSVVGFGCQSDRPSTSQPSAVPAIASRPTPPPQADGKTYKEPNGAFQISFPKGYEYRSTGSGIKFNSADKKFKGFVDFAKTENSLDAEKLEGALREYLDGVLKDVKWQNSSLENSDRIRVDWTGKSAEGEKLDAISYIEQKNNTIYILSLYGVNEAFDTYRIEAEAIVRSYKVQ
ncbi:MAG TPA: hypothetical protein IGS31_19325 [Oscillatoriales cyanobacterium M4454_W2019_049]|nr:hypothetical protein [Oscillatoriales cyanobacterium M4454_W2019_049]